MALASTYDEPTLPASEQPFWGDTIGGSAIVPPADNAYPEPNWEAPLDQWSQWDTAVIAGQRVPGLVSVVARKRLRTRKNQAPGASGAQPTILGFDPTDIDFDVQMWTQAQLGQFELLVHTIQDLTAAALRGPALKRGEQSKRTSAALEVRHPGLALYRIYSLYFLEFTIPRRTAPGSQVFSAQLKFTEFDPMSLNTSAVAVKAALPDDNFTGLPSAFGQPQAATPPSQSTKAVAP